VTVSRDVESERNSDKRSLGKAFVPNWFAHKGEILRQLEAKISAQTLMSVEQPPPAASLIDEAADDESGTAR
jgi:hypothetical protein